jgi:hypothetical protein
MSLLSLCQHNKMLLSAESPQCAVSPSLSILNISRGFCLWSRDGVFSPSLSLGCIPHSLGEVIPLGTNRWLDPEEGLILLVGRGEGLRCTTEPREAQEPVRGAWPVRRVRTRLQILGLSLSGRKGAWSPPRVTRVIMSKSETMTPRCWEQRGNVECLLVNMCEWDVAWLWSECRVLNLESMANSYDLGWALTGPQVQGLYGLTMAKRHLKFLWGTQLETKWVTYCSPLCVRGEDPLSLL